MKILRKTHTNIYIDLDVRHLCNIKGVNISKICNQALKSYLDLEGKNQDEQKLLDDRQNILAMIDNAKNKLAMIDISLQKFDDIKREAEAKREAERKKMKDIESRTISQHLRDLI